MDKSPEILSEQKRVDMIKHLTIIIKRLKDIQAVLLHPNSDLFEGLSETIYGLNANLENNLVSFKTVTLRHKVEALNKVAAGVLCVKVFNSLQKIENKTPLVIIMRGLLDPKEFHEVEENAIKAAEEDMEEFEKDIELLLFLIKRGKLGKVLLKKTVRLKSIVNNIEEFESAKERLEIVEEQL